MKKYFKVKKVNIVCGFSSVFLIFAVWIAVYYAVKNDFVVPSPWDTAAQFFACFKEGSFWASFAHTLLRTLLAFAISLALSSACAFFSVFKPVRLILKPIMTFFRTLPTLAVALIILVWTSATVAPVIIAVLVLFPMLYARMISAGEGIDKELKETCDVFGANPLQKASKLYAPLIAPVVISQAGADISLGLKVVISAEVLANTYKSVGNLIQSAKLFLEMPRLAALTVAAVICGLLIELIFSRVYKTLSF